MDILFTKSAAGKISSILFLITIICMIVSSGCSSSSNSSSEPLTVNMDIATSNNEEAPAVCAENDRYSFEMTFSEDIADDPYENGIILYEKKFDGLNPVKIEIKRISKNAVSVTKLDKKPFEEQSQYMVECKKDAVKGISGKTLKNEIKGYFTILDKFNFENISGDERSRIMIISDVHIPDKRAQDNKYSWFSENGPALVEFLNKVNSSNSIKEFIINGDLFDQWIVPIKMEPFDGKSEEDFFVQMCNDNPSITNSLRDLAANSLIKTTYVPGNHDMLVTTEDLESEFPGMIVAREKNTLNYPNSGLGSYSPECYPGIFIEHGHRYDIMNAPDPVSNREVVNTAKSIIPPGFFLGRVAGTSYIDFPKDKNSSYGFNIDKTDITDVIYWSSWVACLVALPVKDINALKEKSVVMGVDGYNPNYAILGDLVGVYANEKPTLYPDIINKWNDRCAINNAMNNNSPLAPWWDAIMCSAFGTFLDVLGQRIGNDLKKRILVFGHSHDAKIVNFRSYNLNKECLYINSGAWVDQKWNYSNTGDKLPTMTLIVITPPLDGKNVIQAALYKYKKGENEPVLISSSCITAN